MQFLKEGWIYLQSECRLNRIYKVQNDIHEGFILKSDAKMGVFFVNGPHEPSHNTNVSCNNKIVPSKPSVLLLDVHLII